MLSSGFLAFARHVGFLDAVEQAAAEHDGALVDGVCGTSSGALVGALWAAGMAADDIAAELSSRRPLSLMRWNVAFWRGLASIEPALEHLRGLVPARFEDLQRPFGVGVCAPDGSHALLRSGPLPEAVAASCAMPWIFEPVTIDGARYQDGGAVDRLGVAPWRAVRPPERTLWIHEVARTAGREVPVDRTDCVVVTTPRSRASFWSLRDFEAQRREARVVAEQALGAPTE